MEGILQNSFSYLSSNPRPIELFAVLLEMYHLEIDFLFHQVGDVFDYITESIRNITAII